MIIESKKQLQTYKQACQISTAILWELKHATKAGISTLELDSLAFSLCKKHNATPAFVGVDNGYTKYQHATCISVNDTILHGIPSANELLKPGDVVKIDFGLIYQNLFTDQCITLGVTSLSNQDIKLVQTTKNAVLTASRKATAGKTTGFLGSTMHTIAQQQGYDTLKNYVGHGIGHSLHEYPEIPAYGHPLKGSILKKDMVICVEAQVVAGSDQTITDSDTWTIRSADGAKAAMFEYMVLVGKDEPTILTSTYDWDIIAK